MIFSSYEFLLLFLPVVYGLFLLLRYFSMERAAPAVLLLASLYFYAAWNWQYLALLIGSILVNYLLGYRVVSHRGMFWLAVAVVGNLLLLGYYKYAGFFSASCRKVGSGTFCCRWEYPSLRSSR